MRTRNCPGIGRLQNRSVLLFFEDCRTAADDGCIGGDEREVDVPFGIEFSGKPPGVEDQVVALLRQALEFHLRAAFHPGDIEHFRVDVARPRAFMQQVRHQVDGQVVGVGHLLRREIVGEVLIAPPPSLERHAVLARSIQALLDGFMGKIRQFVQFLNKARPAAFAHSEGRDTRVIYVVQFMVTLGQKTSDLGGPQGSLRFLSRQPRSSVKISRPDVSFHITF